MQKYAEAVGLYASTDLSVRQIAEKCGVTAGGLSAHISRYFRPLLFTRYGLDKDNPAGYGLKVKPPRGQSLKTHLKYKDAIEACGDIAYIEFNISQIARLFDLSGPALASQLRVHYPDIIPAREHMRRKLGIADNVHRGVRSASNESYSDALETYRNTDMSIPEVAERCNVSQGGFSQFLRFYHHNLITEKARKRVESRRRIGMRTPGAPSGNGRQYGPEAATVELYARALELYRHTDRTLEEIARETKVPLEGFRSYLSRWHGADIARRRGYNCEESVIPDLRDTRRYLKSTRNKYRDAIKSLRDNPRNVSEVAAEYGLNPDVFREYLKNHEPELAAMQGMTRLSNGNLVKRSAYEKYRDAIEEYSRSPEPLSSIAARHGIVYKSLMAFVKRNCPLERENHRKAVEKALQMQSAYN